MICLFLHLLEDSVACCTVFQGKFRNDSTKGTWLRFTDLSRWRAQPKQKFSKPSQTKRVFNLFRALISVFFVFFFSLRFVSHYLFVTRRCTIVATYKKKQNKTTVCRRLHQSIEDSIGECFLTIIRSAQSVRNSDILSHKR